MENKSKQNEGRARPHRRRLIERTSGIIPSTKAEMGRAYNETYRRKLVSRGIPDRRALEEASMQALLEDAMTPTPEHANWILRSAVEILKSVLNREQEQTYTDAGIKLRIAKVATEITPPKQRTRLQRSEGYLE